MNAATAVPPPRHFPLHEMPQLLHVVQWCRVITLSVTWNAYPSDMVTAMTRRLIPRSPMRGVFADALKELYVFSWMAPRGIDSYS